MWFTIVFGFVGFALMVVGAYIQCMISFESLERNCPLSQATIDRMRDEAAKANKEDQPLKWMQVADEEAGLRMSKEPRSLVDYFGILIMVVGAACAVISAARLFGH